MKKNTERSLTVETPDDFKLFKCSSIVLVFITIGTICNFQAAAAA